MTVSVLQLVDSASETASIVTDQFEKLLQKTKNERIVGYACVLIRDDGAVFVSTRTNNNRTMILGAVHDLAYTIAKQGD